MGASPKRILVVDDEPRSGDLRAHAAPLGYDGRNEENADRAIVRLKKSF